MKNKTPKELTLEEASAIVDQVVTAEMKAHYMTLPSTEFMYQLVTVAQIAYLSVQEDQKALDND